LIFKWDGIGYGCYIGLEELDSLEDVRTERCYMARVDKKKAVEARDLARKLGYPSDRALANLIDSGGIMKCPVTSKDVRSVLDSMSMSYGGGLFPGDRCT
jgi:hypothetical protein